MNKAPITHKHEDREKPASTRKTENAARSTGYSMEHTSFSHSQHIHIGNTALQRLLAQRAPDAPFDLDDATAGRIHRARSGGQALDGAVQVQMGEAMGHDFSGVRVHTDGEAHALNEQLSAKAFTTGADIFFRGGAYSPQSSAGQELLAHELTHVVQQASGVVDGGGAGMRVNAPGDRFEQEADAVAKAVTAAPATSAAPAVQRQELPEEDELQAKSLQRQELEDEELQTMRLQRQELENEELQMPHLQRQEEDENDPSTLLSPRGNEWEMLDNPIWNSVTNNALSGATGLFEAVNPITINMPNFGNTLTRLGGVRGWDAALKMEDALSFPASSLPGVFGASGSIVNSKLPMGMSRASSVLAPLGVISNAMGIYDAFTRDSGGPGGSGLERGGDLVSNSAGLFSSGVGTAALAGAGLETLGATSAGTALSGAAASLGPAAALAGAGAGGYATGQLMDKGVGELMNWTGAGDLIDRSRGISRPQGQQGDYSISGMGADIGTSVDQRITSMMRSMGVLEETEPEYTQTLGWRLAELLPSWLQ